MILNENNGILNLRKIKKAYSIIREIIENKAPWVTKTAPTLSPKSWAFELQIENKLCFLRKINQNQIDYCIRLYGA